MYTSTLNIYPLLIEFDCRVYFTDLIFRPQWYPSSPPWLDCHVYLDPNPIHLSAIFLLCTSVLDDNLHYPFQIWLLYVSTQPNWWFRSLPSSWLPWIPRHPNPTAIYGCSPSLIYLTLILDKCEMFGCAFSHKTKCQFLYSSHCVLAHVVDLLSLIADCYICIVYLNSKYLSSPRRIWLSFILYWSNLSSSMISILSSLTWLSCIP